MNLGSINLFAIGAGVAFIGIAAASSTIVLIGGIVCVVAGVLR